MLAEIIAGILNALRAYFDDSPGTKKAIVAVLALLLVTVAGFLVLTTSPLASLYETDSDKNLEKCERKYSNKEYNGALQCFENIVEGRSLVNIVFDDVANLARSYYKIGDIYYHGHSVVKQRQRAFSFYEKAAELGDTKALIELGHHAESSGKLYEARDRYEKAAEKGDVEAMYRLAALYQLNKEFDHNFKEALYWYSEAVKKGHIRAMADLGYLHFQGYGIDEPDYKAAISWYRRADRVLKGEDCYRLGLMYAQGGHGIEQDIQKAIKHYEKAARMQYVDAALELAKMMVRSDSHEKAIEWYEAVAERSDDAKRELAKIYRDVPRQLDKERALELFLGIEEKNAVDLFNTALTYRQLGEFEKAIHYYQESVDGGYSEAAFHLGYIYEKEAKPRDKPQAVKWYKKAAELGYKDAEIALEAL